MALHITVVGFGKAPIVTEDALLTYLAYDPESAGKIVAGSIEVFKVNTKVEGVEILHLAVRDANIDSDNLSLVFEQPWPADKRDDQAWLDARTYTMGIILGETISRGGARIYVVEGLLEDNFGNAGYCISGVREAIEADLTQAMRA